MNSNIDDVAPQIHSLEDKRYQAMIEADTNVLEQLFGDGLVYTHSTGTADGKAAYLEGVRSANFAYKQIERSDECIQVYGDTAVVTGRARADMIVGGVPRLATLRYTCVWVKAINGWQTVAFQATSAPS